MNLIQIFSSSQNYFQIRRNDLNCFFSSRRFLRELHFWGEFGVNGILGLVLIQIQGDIGVFTQTLIPQDPQTLIQHGFNAETLDEHDLPQELVDQIEGVPFLNGGLFKLNDLDEVGFKITDELLETIIFDFFERYNFTVAEDTPLDQIVAVDPEMLEKVYESMIGETSSIPTFLT